MSAGSTSATGLARWRLLRGRRALALTLCVAGAVAVSWALPLGASAALRSGLRSALSSAQLTVEQPQVRDFDGFVAFEREAAARVEPRLGPYLAPADGFATVAPMTAVSVGDRPPRPGAPPLTAVYRDGLASHVEILAGELPPDGLGGASTAVTMPQRGADQLGLRLSDRFCVELAPGASAAVWCGRLVGLWRPLSSADAYWAGRPPELEVTLGRYDFFQLLRLHPPRGATAGRRYVADLTAADPAAARELAGRLRGLRASFAGAGSMRLSQSLDAALVRYDAAQRPAALTLNVLVTTLALLTLCLVQLTASRVADLQAADVALLRARGWPAGAAWRLLFAQLGGVALTALPVGLLGAALVTVLVGLSTPGDLALAATSLAGASLAGVLAAAVALLAVAAWSVAGGPPGREPAALGPAVAWWRRWNVDLLMGGLGLALLLARPGAAGDALRFLAPALAVALLGLVAPRALPAMGSLAGLWPAGVPAALAGWQLGRRPDQHAGLVLLEVLALAAAGFCALNLAVQPHAVAELAALHQGFDAVLTAALMGALAIGLSGGWLHFRAAARARRREYVALAVNGLTPAAARRSLGLEQLFVLAYAGGVGTLLALMLVAAVTGDVAPGRLWARPGSVAVAALAWATLPAGLALVSWLVRRASFRGGVLEGLRWAP